MTSIELGNESNDNKQSDLSITAMTSATKAIDDESSRIGADNMTTMTSTSTTATYVDYTPPQAAKIQPPANYKLALIIYVLVYFVVWFTSEAGLLEFLRFKGWLSPGAAFVLMLTIIVFVLVFATLDLLVSLLTFQNKKTHQLYGLGAWLKQPRVTWIYRYDNVVAEMIAGIIRILEDGFTMFDAPEMIGAPTMPKHFTCPNGKCERVLKIEHRIDPTKIKEYNRWLERIEEVAKQEAHGLLQRQLSVSYLDENGDDVEVGGDTLVATDEESANNMTGGLLHSFINKFP